MYRVVWPKGVWGEREGESERERGKKEEEEEGGASGTARLSQSQCSGHREAEFWWGVRGHSGVLTASNLPTPSTFPEMTNILWEQNWTPCAQ